MTFPRGKAYKLHSNSKLLIHQVILVTSKSSMKVLIRVVGKTKIVLTNWTS